MDSMDKNFLGNTLGNTQLGGNLFAGGKPEDDEQEGGEGNDEFAGGKDKIPFMGGKPENDEQEGLEGNNDFMGGNDRNPLAGGKPENDEQEGLEGNNDFMGGKDKNLFVYHGGEKIINDYDNKKDRINLSGASIADVEISDGNLIFTLDNENTLTINDFAGKEIAFFDGTKTTKNYFDNHAIFDGLNSQAKCNIQERYTSAGVL